MKKTDIDMDTVTNIILNNEYDLHEKDDEIYERKHNYNQNKENNRKRKVKIYLKIFTILII